MSVTYHLEPRGRLALVQAIDVVTPADWDCAIDRLLADPAFEPGCPILVDRRREDAIDRAASLVRMIQLLDRHSAALGASRWGILVDRSNLEACGATRLAAERAAIRHVEIEAFVAIEHAVRWLLGNEADWIELAEICVWTIKTAPTDPFVTTRMTLGPVANAVAA